MLVCWYAGTTSISRWDLGEVKTNRLGRCSRVQVLRVRRMKELRKKKKGIFHLLAVLYACTS